MAKEDKILFPTEFGPLGEKARAEAVHLAETHGAEIVLLHAFNIPTGISRLFSAVSEDEVRKRAQAELEDYASELRKLGNVEVMTMVRSNPRPEVAIVEAAQEMDCKMIVFGTRGGNGLKDTLLGSAVNYVIRHTPCPVLTIRNTPEHTGFNNILVPMDLAQEAGEKLRHGVQLAKENGGKLNLFSVVANKGKEQMRLQERIKWSREYAMKEGVTNVDVTLEETNLPVAEAVLAFADRIEADLVCVMTQQESDSNLKATVLGSVADQIVNASQRPVMSIRPERHYSSKAWKSHHFT